jgi:hypothetical protein
MPLIAKGDKSIIRGKWLGIVSRHITITVSILDHIDIRRVTPYSARWLNTRNTDA